LTGHHVGCRDIGQLNTTRLYNHTRRTTNPSVRTKEATVHQIEHPLFSTFLATLSALPNLNHIWVHLYVRTSIPSSMLTTHMSKCHSIHLTSTAVKKILASSRASAAPVPMLENTVYLPSSPKPRHRLRLESSQVPGSPGLNYSRRGCGTVLTGLQDVCVAKKSMRKSR
jgi:hypothetical protein